jgi:hypothetical protein
MQQAVITTDALEMLARLNEAAKELLAAATALREELREARLGALRPALMDTKEAAAYLGISPATMKRYQDGMIGGRTPMPERVEVGDRVLYEKTELDRWIREDLPRFGGRGKRKEAA